MLHRASLICVIFAVACADFLCHVLVIPASFNYLMCAYFGESALGHLGATQLCLEIALRVLRRLCSSVVHVGHGIQLLPATAFTTFMVICIQWSLIIAVTVVWELH